MAYDKVKSWKHASEADARALAQDWAADVDQEREDVQQTVVMMDFTAPPHLIWTFILTAIAAAQTDDQLGALAAGSMERLMGVEGDAYIEKFEVHAAANPKFARAVCGMWKYMISDANWRRIELIQHRPEK